MSYKTAIFKCVACGERTPCEAKITIMSGDKESVSTPCNCMYKDIDEEPVWKLVEEQDKKIII